MNVVGNATKEARRVTVNPTFGTTDAPQHRIDSDEWADICVVGDVHGCRATLERLVASLDPGQDDLLIFVGDLIRKGPDSKGALDVVRRRPNFRAVRGNNEQKVLDERASLPELTDDDVAYIDSLPVSIAWDDVVVVHGGIDHRKPLAQHTTGELLTMRSLAPGGKYERPFWFETRRQTPRVFFGHTVLSEPFESDYAVGLDTGCVYGGRLTAYDYRASGFVAVDPPETYRPRADDSIVEPQPPASTSGR